MNLARAPAHAPPVRDLALDPLTGRMLLAGGRARLTEPGAEAVGQRLRFRLSLWQGEYVLDRAVGIPALSVILAKGRTALAEALLRRAIATCPGVASLRSFSLDLDRATRASSVAFDARTIDGEPVTLDAFRVTP